MSQQNPLRGWRVERAAIRMVGRDLRRPECILAERDGTLWCADARGGVMRIDPQGSQELIAQRIDYRVDEAVDGGRREERYILNGTLPNGLAFARNGDILIANFGTDAIERMTRGGQSRTLLTSIEGRPLGKVNFILRDSRDRLWITVHTRRDPWTLCVREKTADGYIALLDERGIRIVADGFVGTNEIRMDLEEEWLYVVESNARHVSRLRVSRDGSLAAREVFGPADLGGVPDGFAFDSRGNLWVTLVMYDRLIALTPEGDVLTLLDDGDPLKNAELDRHFYAGTVTPELMLATRGTLAPWLSSVTFGGPDLKTVYLGSLMGTSIPCFRSPVAGLPMVHWNE
ncbi:MAG: SMP-30/gluconolactonase/LRE family protein [Steroidobacteraceae bacterium]